MRKNQGTMPVKTEASLFEFGHQERGTLSPPSPVSDGVLNRDLIEDGTVIQFEGDGVSDGPHLGVVVFGGEGFILDTSNLGTESVNSGVSGSSVSAAQGSAIGKKGRWNGHVLGLGGQLPENERICDHIVDVMAICAKCVSDNR